MNRRILKFLTIFLPLLFFVGLILLRSSLTGSPWLWGIEILVVLLAFLGIVLFSSWVFERVERNEREIKSRSEQLAALHEAALALTEELDLTKVLQKVVDLARGLTNARYGALGVLREDGRWINHFISSGIPEAERARIGALPRGEGLLGAVIEEDRPVRVATIEGDPRSVGFPPHHPKLQSFLGVPIRFKTEVIGELYLANKLSLSGEVTGFTEQDQMILEMFATQAAIAIKNAQLYRQSQQLTVLQERERFGMDLHDGIIQSIYAIGLLLDDVHHRLPEEVRPVREGIQTAISGLNDVIRDIRNYILDLRPNRFQGRDLKEGLGELAREVRANSFLEVDLDVSGPDVSFLNPEETVEILLIAQEGLSNVRKHAHATRVEIQLEQREGVLMLRIQDDGVGMDPDQVNASSGNGLRNMRERAARLGGKLEVSSKKNQGTRIVVSLPTG